MTDDEKGAVPIAPVLYPSIEASAWSRERLVNEEEHRLVEAVQAAELCNVADATSRCLLVDFTDDVKVDVVYFQRPGKRPWWSSFVFCYVPIDERFWRLKCTFGLKWLQLDFTIDDKGAAAAKKMRDEILAKKFEHDAAVRALADFRAMRLQTT